MLCGSRVIFVHAFTYRFSTKDNFNRLGAGTKLVPTPSKIFFALIRALSYVN